MFLRKIIKGSADQSYGIEVAKLAGVPKEVVSRAKSILKGLEHLAPVQRAERVEEEEQNLSFSSMAEAEIADTLRSTDLNTLTPIEAMGLLYRLKKKAEM